MWTCPATIMTSSQGKQFCFHLSSKMNILLRHQTMVLLASLQCVLLSLLFMLCFCRNSLRGRLSHSLSNSKRINSQTGCPIVLDKMMSDFRGKNLLWALTDISKTGSISAAAHLITLGYHKSVKHILFIMY